jgi:thioredoxin-like negative regulator of GroEL
MPTRLPLVSLLLVLVSAPLCAQSLKPSNDIPALESAVARDSNDAQLHYQVAIAYWSRKRYDAATLEGAVDGK